MAQRPKAYSYLRFSTPEQAQGDSYRRQTEAATAYAERHGLDLDNLTYKDLGVSAYRGRNAVEGALGQFIEAVDSGKVKAGSYLLIENLDRLSRDRIMPALNQFSSLLERGIKVVTLSDGKTYDAASLDNLPDLMMSLMVMSRAHEESKLKSQRLRAAWKQKKKRAGNGEILTARIPAWLRVRDGSFEVDKRRAKVVRRIFDMASQGHGKAAIALRLNRDKVAVFGTADGWYPSYITKILRNPAVIGTYQPHRNTYVEGKKKRVPEGDPVAGYFPAVVEPSLFFQVKHSRPGPSGKGQSLPRNVLSGIVFCARCGGKSHFVNKGRGHVYLACDNVRRKRTCDAPAVPYQPVLDAVLASAKEFRDVSPDSSAAKERDRELDALGGQIEETQESIARLVDSLERVASEAMEQRLADHEAKLATLKARRAELREKKISRDIRPPSRGVYDTFENTSPWLPAGKDSARDLTAHMAAELRRMVERVIIEKGQPVKVVPRSE